MLRARVFPTCLACHRVSKQPRQKERKLRSLLVVFVFVRQCVANFDGPSILARFSGRMATASEEAPSQSSSPAGNKPAVEGSPSSAFRSQGSCKVLCHKILMTKGSVSVKS